MKLLAVGDLRKAIEGVSDDMLVFASTTALIDGDEDTCGGSAVDAFVSSRKGESHFVIEANGINCAIRGCRNPAEGCQEWKQSHTYAGHCDEHPHDANDPRQTEEAFYSESPSTDV